MKDAPTMRVLSYEDLLAVKGIRYSREHLLRLMKTGGFPQSFKLAAHGRTVWDEATIDRWLADRQRSASTPPPRAPRRPLIAPAPTPAPRRRVV
jgi:predicted DNA-binding transcriptional regulator AlpA